MATRRAPAPAASSSDAESTKVRVPSVDTVTAFGIARNTLKLINNRGVRARLRVLPESELPSSVLDGYETTLTAAETASAEYEVARSGDSDARVSVVLIRRGTEISARMQRCLSYSLEGDVEVERQLAAIRRGTGHSDSAEDLAALSVLYGTHAAAIRSDSRNYRATDAADSVAVSGEIRDELAKGERAVTRKAGQKWAKAFAALDASHQEIVDAGRYFDRRQPALAARWVYLLTPAARPTPKTPKTPKSPA